MKNVIAFIILGMISVSCAGTSKKTTTADVKDTKKEAAASKSAGSNSALVTCTSKNDSRTLEIKGSGSAYEVIYTKFGEAKTIATGGKEHTEAIKERVKSNLAKAGYTCN